MQKTLISIGFNELNFQTLEKYIAAGKLPNFMHVIKRYGYVVTKSEDVHKNIEPWIQWPTIHTGKPFGEHNLFRLGQIKNKDIEQIWESLEKKGVSAGAICPMNATNRMKNPAYFVPDPWAGAKVSGGWILQRLYDSIAQAVNDNAASKLTFTSAVFLLIGAARFARVKNYSSYLKLIWRARNKKWNLALILDLLLSDCFVKLQKSKRPQFGSLFLNAGAHIQHHYLYSSRFFEGPQKNPDWYVSPADDPIFDVYNLYDKVLGQILEAFPKARLHLLTGLHQTPCSGTTYYWRLKNPETLLKKLGLDFVRIEQKMSRDFLVLFENSAQTNLASQFLKSAEDHDGDPVFSVDSRGKELFVELIIGKNVTESFHFTIGSQKVCNIHEHVVFVAIKNGEHCGEGYFLDSGNKNAAGKRTSIPLTSIFGIVNKFFTNVA